MNLIISENITKNDVDLLEKIVKSDENYKLDDTKKSQKSPYTFPRIVTSVTSVTNTDTNIPLKDPKGDGVC
jgi:hypothetical protein